MKINFLKVQTNFNQRQNKADFLPVLNNDSKSTPSAKHDFNRYLVNFKGLNRDLSRTFYKEHKLIKASVFKNTLSNGIVGNLPKEWIERIPKEMRAEKIKELYFDLKISIDSFKNKFWKSQTERDLTNAFKKAGIIEEKKHITLKFIDSGTDGKVYHLHGLPDGQFVIKLFQPEFSHLYKEEHASLLELNSAAFWQKKVGKKTQMVRFYFGDADAGYMVNKFIGKKSKLPEKYVYPEIYGLKSKDVDPKCVETGHNKIRGYQIDWGCIALYDDFLNKDKNSQKIMRNFFNASDEKRYKVFEESCKNDSRFKFYFANCIDVLPEKERELYFDKLLESKDSKVRAVLADQISCFKGQKRTDYFYKLINDAELNVKKVLVTKLHCLETEDIVYNFKELATGADDDVKTLLIPRLRYLQDEERVFWFKKFAENADEKTTALLNRFIYYVPDEQMAECKALIKL